MLCAGRQWWSRPPAPAAGGAAGPWAAREKGRRRGGASPRSREEGEVGTVRPPCHAAGAPSFRSAAPPGRIAPVRVPDPARERDGAFSNGPAVTSRGARCREPGRERPPAAARQARRSPRRRPRYPCDLCVVRRRGCAPAGDVCGNGRACPTPRRRAAGGDRVSGCGPTGQVVNARARPADVRRRPLRRRRRFCNSCPGGAAAGFDPVRWVRRQPGREP